MLDLRRLHYQLLDASADNDAPIQGSKQGTVLIETIFCGLYN